MQTVKEIKKSIDDVEGLKLLASTYSDVAGTKLLMIRSTIEKNRQFVAELATVFHIIKTAAEKQKTTLIRSKRGVANLVLTSNHRFYGGLENRLLDFFTTHLVLSRGDNYVTGRTGDLFLKDKTFLGDFKSCIFKKDLPTGEELDELTDQLLRYQTIRIYHTKMKSVLVQRPVITEVGGLADISAEVDPRLTYYIFEPEIERIVDFFDTKVTKVLLEQAFLEAELARTAARLVSMEQTQTKANTAIARERKNLVRAEASLANVRMLEIVQALAAKKSMRV